MSRHLVIAQAVMEEIVQWPTALDGWAKETAMPLFCATIWTEICVMTMALALCSKEPWLLVGHLHLGIERKITHLENLVIIRYCISEHNVTSSFVPVCHEDYAYFAKVPQGGSVTVKMWYNDPDHFKHSTCNVWCFNQHEKPDPRYKESPLQKFFVEVVWISHFKILCIFH